MSLDTLKERILSDAAKEAEALLAAAASKAAQIEEEAERTAKEDRAREESEVAVRIRAMEEGSAATVRLESKKSNLKERRRVIDTIYDRALDALLALPEKQSVELLTALLKEYDAQAMWVALDGTLLYSDGFQTAIHK